MQTLRETDSALASSTFIQLWSSDSCSFACSSVSPTIGITPGSTASSCGSRPYLTIRCLSEL